MKVGVLALQGGYAAHAHHLEHCGATTRLVTLPEHLEGLQGLVIPGGESTALLKLMAPHRMLAAIRLFIQQGGGLLATCAGMILAAQHVTPDQPCLQVIDIDVSRNAYGRQLDSHIIPGALHLPSGPIPDFEMFFIRAPKITRVGAKVNVLASVEDQPVMVQQGNVIALAFHPELTPDTRIHEYFLKTLAK
jgi:pyridoxal 5'-phosphate synthase pdxT subunit